VTVRLNTNQGRGVLLATVFGSGVAFLDTTVVNLALPTIGRDLHAGMTGLQWTVDAYMLTLSALLLVGGSLGDALGHRRVFVLGLIWFGVASLACALAPSIGTLVVARAVQGAGAALLVPGSLAVLRESFAEDEQGKVIGAWSGLSGVTAALGPLVGGWLIGTWSWRIAFYLNLPLVAGAIWAALRCVPETRISRRANIDVAGAVTVTASLAALVYALIEAPAHRPGVSLAAAGGAALLAVFLLIEARRPNPMLPLGLFRSRQFSGANAVTLAVYFALGGATFLLVLQLQGVVGYSPLAAGAALTPVTVLLLVLSPVAGKIGSRIGYRVPMTIGPILAGAGVALLAPIGPGSSYVTALLPGIVVLGIGLATTVAPLTTAVLAGAEEGRAGIAAGVNTAIARLAGLLSVALLPLVAGITGTDAASLAGGFARAMWICAIVCAGGGIVAFTTLRR
jgi:EmrB/QacA subfamily drug resistance transporter